MATEDPSNATAAPVVGPSPGPVPAGTTKSPRAEQSEDPSKQGVKGAISPRAGASPTKQANASLGFKMIYALGFPDPGVFRMADKLFGWKKDAGPPSSKDVPEKVIRQSDGVKSIIWYPISAKDAALTFKMNDESHLTFVGFKDADKGQINRFIRHHWKLEVESSKMATRGWHWGSYDFHGDDLCVSINNDPAFYINAKRIKRMDRPGKAKNELHIGFEDEGPLTRGGDQVYDMKFHVVPEEEDDKREGDMKQASPLEYLYNSLLAKSNLTTATASNVAFILEYMNLASPPGRFDIHVVKDGFKLFGKSGNFGPINWSAVSNLYHLETKPNSYLVMELSAALRKGQTSYPYIVVGMEDKKQREIHLNLAEDGPTDQQLIKKYQLTEVMRRPEKIIVPKLLAIYCGKLPWRAKAKEASADSERTIVMAAIECSYKQQLGKLVLMDHCIIFAPKPVTILKHEDIGMVDFRSPSARTRLFKFCILMKAQKGNAAVEHSLDAIDRSEFDKILNYFSELKIKTRTGTTEEGPEGQVENENHPNLEDDIDEDSEDEDFHDDDHESDDRGMSDLEPDDDQEHSRGSTPLQK